MKTMIRGACPSRETLIKRLAVLGIVSFVFLVCCGGSTVTGVNVSPMSSGPHGWYNVGPTEPGIWASIAVDPSGSGTVYLAPIGGGIRKSTDNGKTWTSVGFPLDEVAFYSFAMDASGPDTIYAGVFSPFSSAPSGVYKSTDGGTSWKLTSPSLIPPSLQADPTTPGVVYAGTLGGALLKTTDAGETWTTTYSSTLPIFAIQIDPWDGNNVYIATLAR